MIQKEIKAIKREIVEDGILSRGYSWNIRKVFCCSEIIEALITLQESGIRLANEPEAFQDNFLLTELIKNQNYQDFKNKTLQYIFH